jgi:hypothetical protein
MAIFIATNVLWAAAFIGYVHRSTTPLVKQLGNAPTTPGKDAPTAKSSNAVPVVAKNVTNEIAISSPTNSPARVVKSLPSADKKFGWQDVTNDIYLDYIANLRASGCPEKQIRGIILSDVNELFDQRRLEHAIKTDPQWWKAETFMGVLPMQGFVGANFDEQRRELLTKILGEEWYDFVKLPSMNNGAVNLTGPVLGALPPETWNSVQEICARSMERHQAYQMARINEGGAIDNAELAKLREQTRADLKKVLNAEQLEEFLLRYSFNSSKLRADMRGIELTPDEFRKIFRATDPLEHQMQVDYGSTETLSQKQREQLESQRDRVVRETLSGDRYVQYLASKDPLFKQAQMMAMQYGMNTKAIKPLYDMQKNLDAKRLQVSQNTTLTPEQKNQALQSIGTEHQLLLQQILGNQSYRLGN